MHAICVVALAVSILGCVSSCRGTAVFVVVAWISSSPVRMFIVHGLQRG